jgi:hypothetical protein
MYILTNNLANNNIGDGGAKYLESANWTNLTSIYLGTS